MSCSRLTLYLSDDYSCKSAPVGLQFYYQLHWLWKNSIHQHTFYCFEKFFIKYTVPTTSIFYFFTFLLQFYLLNCGMGILFHSGTIYGNELTQYGENQSPWFKKPSTVSTIFAQDYLKIRWIYMYMHAVLYKVISENPYINRSNKCQKEITCTWIVFCYFCSMHLFSVRKQEIW